MRIPITMKPQKTYTLLPYITILLFLLAWNVNAQVLIDSVIAVVDGQAITQSELVNEFRIETIIDKPVSHEPTDIEKRVYLERIINRKIVLQEAKKLGITTSDRKKQVDERIAEIRTKFPSGDAFNAIIQKQEIEIEVLNEWVYDHVIFNEYFKLEFVSTIDSDEIDDLAPQYFEGNKAQFVVPAKVTFRSLLVTVPSDISEKDRLITKDLVERINVSLQEGDTFEAVSQRFKTDPSVSLNSLTLAVDTPLGAIVTQLNPSERKGPILVTEGFAIVELIKKIPSRQKQYSEVKDEIANLIHQQIADTAYKTWLSKQKTKMPWYILEDALKRVSQIRIPPVK